MVDVHSGEGAVGLAVPERGIVHGLANEIYHALPAISNTGLLLVGKSPRHFYGRYLDPLRPPPKPPKPAQFFGTLTHCAFLEPAEFPLRYPIGPDVKSRNNKAWSDFERTLKPNQLGVKPDEREAVMTMVRNLRALPDVRDLMAKGRPEVSAFWTEHVLVDEQTGEQVVVRCRVRPDWVHDIDDKRVILLDVKTCGDASEAEFARQILRQNYHHQAAFYIDGYEKATGKEVVEFVFAQVEDEWPHVANSCALYPEDIEIGRVMYRANLRTYAQCLSTDTWPGYSEHVQLVSLPSYGKRK